MTTPMKADDPPIVVEKVYSTSQEGVWRAWTDLAELHRWFFPQIPDFRAEVGFTTAFTIEHEGRTFTHTWEILEVSEGHSFKMSWNYREYPGDSTLSVELTAEDDGTRCRITDEILEDFPDDIPEFQRESCIAGWEYFLDALGKYLSN